MRPARPKQQTLQNYSEIHFVLHTNANNTTRCCPCLHVVLNCFSLTCAERFGWEVATTVKEYGALAEVRQSCSGSTNMHVCLMTGA